MTSVSVTWGEATDVLGSDNDRRRLGIPLGLLLAVSCGVGGFGLIAFTWWKVSDLTNIAQQLPYFVSGGLTGLGLVIVCAALLVVEARGRDDAQREARAQALVDALKALAAKDEEAGR